MEMDVRSISLEERRAMLEQRRAAVARQLRRLAIELTDLDRQLDQIKRSESVAKSGIWDYASWLPNCLIDAIGKDGAKRWVNRDCRYDRRVVPLLVAPAADWVAANNRICCPQTRQSAGKSMSKGRGKGDPWLAGTLGRIAFASSRDRHLPGRRYRRLARHRGKQKAIVATGNSVLTVVYHLLSDLDAKFCDLGPGYYEYRINKHRRARDLATQLQALTGQHVAIRDGKAIITDNAA